MSVSFDELLIVSPDQALLLTVTGWAFALFVSEAVLFVTNIRFPMCYRLPYHLAIALLFWFPYFSSPELTEFNEEQTQWRLLAFPWLTAAVALTLLPAIWQGRRSVSGNTTPWKWPVFPWALFVFLGVVCVMRTYVLTFSFGPSDSFETSFGALHLYPMAVALAVLLLEAGVKHRRVGFQVLAMTLPVIASGAVILESNRHLSVEIARGQFAAHVGDPNIAACIVAALFYILAALRRVPLADLGLVIAVNGALSAGGWTDGGLPHSTLVAMGLVYFTAGVWTRSATRMLIGFAILSGQWLVAPVISPFAELRVSLAFHTALLGLMIVGPIRGGQVGRWIISGVLVLMVVASFAALVGYESSVMTPHWSISYAGCMGCACVLYGRLIGDPRFQIAAKLIALLLALRLLWIAIQAIDAAIGRRATATLIAGTTSFVIAGAISALKSRRALLPSTDQANGHFGDRS